MKLTLKLGDCTVRMDGLAEGSVDALISDPPYDLTSASRGGSPRVQGTGPYGRHTNDTVSGPKGFMGKAWDGTGIAFSQHFWGRVYRVLAPGGIAKAFGGSRTFHRMGEAMEEAGFEDIHLEAWAYGSGFPKSMNVSKAIDKMKGAKREMKRIPHSGEAMMRHGGENTRPWIEEAIKNGYHEVQGDTPASPEALAWDGWGTALKPAWEPVLVGRKPA